MLRESARMKEAMETLPDPASATERRGSEEELIEDLYELLQIPHSERERQYPAVARLLHQRRPSSWLSATSTACSESSSKRNTQASFASTNTSYSSGSFNAFQAGPSLPMVAEETNDNAATRPGATRSQNAGSSLSRRLQKRFTPTASSSVSSRDPSSTPGATDDSGPSSTKDAKRRWCPWCQETFSRPNDFKKHVMKYCCETKFFVCRNQACRRRVSQEKQANLHRRDSDDVVCRQHGWYSIELQCKRQHFGCGYCAVYFDNVEAYIEHFGGTCRPDRVRGHWTHARQIKALLQQPALLPMVESLCIEYRGYNDAYRALWWGLQSYRMEKLIRRLEYGPMASVDDRHPGIPTDRIRDFLTDLIKPSVYSIWAADILIEPAAETNVTDTREKQHPLQPYMIESAGPRSSSFSGYAQSHLPNLNGQINTNCNHLSASSVDGISDPFAPAGQYFQPQSAPALRAHELDIPLGTVPAHQPLGDLQYDWTGMTIDDSNDMLVEIQWIDQELGHNWNTNLH